MEFKIPEYVNIVLDKIQASGFEAYIVGGSVRDLILGKEPSDYDVTTSATPDKVEEIFKDFKTIYIGKEFGTVVVVQPEGNIEVTTYRSEGKYLDGRRPSQVHFSKDILEDLKRRDFTINSIAYNKEKGILDPFHGREDIDKGIIRTVGDPYERFSEDYLRILRAARFSAQLKFTFEENTFKACKDLSNSLSYISVERIQSELFKILVTDIPSYGIKTMLELGILKIIVPELIDAVDYDQRTPYHAKNLFDHVMCVLDNTPSILSVRMAALLHDIAKPRTFSMDEKGIAHYYNHDKIGAEVAKEILARLRCSNDFIETVAILVREHMHLKNVKSKGLKRQLARVGEENIFNLIALKKADMICKRDNKDVSIIEERELRIREILKDQEPYKKSHLKINGDDIIALGYESGSLIGEMLDYLVDKVIEHPEHNTKEKLIKLIKGKYYG